MNAPSITPAQILALVQAALAVVVAFGLDITQRQQDAILALSTAALVVIVAADTALRRGRQKHLAPLVPPPPVAPPTTLQPPQG